METQAPPSAQFAYVVNEFAMDGPADPFSLLAEVPRLPYRSGMTMLRELIDELGCDDTARIHSQLCHDLLIELDMTTDMNSYLDNGPESYCSVNPFHLLANRTESSEYFLGDHAFSEASASTASGGAERAAH
ncbi:iron-containing redox enzyme family protein [Streptomyces sp. NPDC002913]